jgi:hypothetical protein
MPFSWRVQIMPGSIDTSLAHVPDRPSINTESIDDNLSSPTPAGLAAMLKAELANDLRSQIGWENLRTFSSGGVGHSPARTGLIAERIVGPYVTYLRDSGQLANRDVVENVKALVHRLAGPALAQQIGNPQQYVSHGFDHSERVASYTDRFINAYPEIARSAVTKYGISSTLARLLFQIVAHWHDVGYPDLKGRPKPTHGLTGAAKFDSVSEPLKRLIANDSRSVSSGKCLVATTGRSTSNANSRTDTIVADMKKAILLHSGDVNAESYPIKVKTSHGALLVSDVDALSALLDHYATASRVRPEVSNIEIRGEHARALEGQVKNLLARRPAEGGIEVSACEDKVDFRGRPTALEKNNQVKVGIRYTELDLTKNPFAVIRPADNLDMAADRLSSPQRSAAFRAMYWKLGDQGPIAKALADLSQLNRDDRSKVPDVLRSLRSARTSKTVDAPDASILSVTERLDPDTIHRLDASSARGLLIGATVDGILRSPLAAGLSEGERVDLGKIGRYLNGESIRHFGGCEAIENIDVERGKVIVTVNKPLFDKLNAVKDPDGTGIGAYQIARAKQALSSLDIDGARPAIEVVGRETSPA